MTDSMDTSALCAEGESCVTADSAAAQGGDAQACEAHPAMALYEQVCERTRAAAEATKSAEALLKTLRKEMKKICKRRRKPSGVPSNLMKPIRLSDALCDFLGRERGAEMTRGHVTSMVNAYASSNGLKKQGNGRVIVLDAALAELLGLAAGDEVQIFRVPTHLKMQNHYVKEAPVSA